MMQKGTNVRAEAEDKSWNDQLIGAALIDLLVSQDRIVSQQTHAPTQQARAEQIDIALVSTLRLVEATLGIQ